MAASAARAETRPVEIACDESGYEGEKLIGTSTDVFAHASVRMDLAAAADCMRELRARIRSPAQEYKANHILREKHRRVLDWFLGTSGPVLGHAHVFLIDKEFFVLTRIGELLGHDLFGDTPAQHREIAGEAFLEAANNLLRGKGSVDAFFRTVPPGSPLLAGRPRAERFQADLARDPATLSYIDPLIPAILRAVAYWGRDGNAVAIVHDRQTTLPVGRVAALQRLSGQLVSLTLADSRTDPRVQVADVLAGAIRKIASNERNGHGDPALTALLPSYVDAESIWADAQSWSRIRPTDHHRV